jgi:hypothetical protein
MDLDERNNHVVSDPTSDVFWAVKSLDEEPNQQLTTPQDTLSNLTVDTGLLFTEKSESNTAEKLKTDTSRKRTSSSDAFEPPTKMVAGNSLEKTNSAGHAKTTMAGLKQGTKKVNLTHKSEPVAPTTAVEKNGHKINTGRFIFCKSNFVSFDSAKKKFTEGSETASGFQRRRAIEALEARAPQT